jgi:tetratricopeptide (TPR) repeat protein
MTPVAANPALGSDSLWHEAQACLREGRLDAARALLPPMFARGSGEARAHLVAAQIAWREDRIRDGTRHALAAAHAAPGDPETLCALVAVLLETGETVVARECLAHPVLAGSLDPVVLMRIAGFRKRLEEHAETLALLDKVRASGHDTAALRFKRGEALLFNGRLEEAEAELAGSLAQAPAYGRVALPLVRLRKQTPERNQLALLERSMRHVAHGSHDHAALLFAQYKVFEDLGRDEEAWVSLAQGNALMYARLKNESSRYHAWLEHFLHACPSGSPQTAPRASRGATPIFIVGVPRSGTTLLERMLGNHSRVATTGELKDFGAQLHWLADTRNIGSESLLEKLPELDYAELGRRYLARTQWRAGGRAFFIDKQPPNWVLAGAIHAALPQAPILNLVRDPMDTCFSNWRAYFGDACAYSYDLHALAIYFRDYRNTMAHWHRTMPGAILDVRYADLVSEPEAMLRKVFDFCGLEWEAGCGDITRNAAPSATLSTAQVRAPLHARAFGEWRRYEKPLERLRRALGDDGTSVPGA